MKQYYVYIWFRKDGSPYYVGKGCDDRAFVNDGHNVHRPDSLDRIFVQNFPSEAEAFAEEIALIKYFGRKDLGTGCLRNLTDGGENPPSWKGKRRSQHHRDAVKAAKQGTNFTPAAREAARLASQRRRGISRETPWMIGFKHSEESKAKIRAAKLGKKMAPHTEEWKQAMSAKMKGRKITWGDKISAAKRAGID